ncbi:MAG: response regulator transcription factor [Clostridia bacterium]|nr:response regulator transcription factor [Clostridia bacterium]
MNKKILLSEDEKDLAKAISTILKYSEYDVTVVYNGKDALNKTREDSFDLIIMDVMMPVMNGIDALKEMRRNGLKTPIIMLTAKSQINDKVEGLDSGANDYITKPFETKELLARIRALTRVDDINKMSFEVGNIIFNSESSEISNNKTTLCLNNEESKIMQILVKNQERTISQNEIGKKVWPEKSEYDEVVDMYISYLQEKLGALDANIKITGEGEYKLEKIG